MLIFSFIVPTLLDVSEETKIWSLVSLRVIEQYILSTTEDRRVEFGVSVIKSKKLMKKMKILQTENMFMHFIDN